MIIMINYNNYAIMVVKTIIDELNDIYDNAYEVYIMNLYRNLYSYNDFIDKYIKDTDLIRRWKIELDTLNNEAIYGDNDDFTDLVIKDCLLVLDEIAVLLGLKKLAIEKAITAEQRKRITEGSRIFRYCISQTNSCICLWQRWFSYNE